MSVCSTPWGLGPWEYWLVFKHSEPQAPDRFCHISIIQAFSQEAKWKRNTSESPSPNKPAYMDPEAGLWLAYTCHGLPTSTGLHVGSLDLELRHRGGCYRFTCGAVPGTTEWNTQGGYPCFSQHFGVHSLLYGNHWLS